MKTRWISFLLLSSLMWMLTGTACGDLTKEDLRQIEEIVSKIVDAKFQVLDVKITGLDQRLQQMSGWIYALIALVTGAIMLPQLIIAFKEKGTTALREEVARLRQEVDALRQSRIVRP